MDCERQSAGDSAVAAPSALRRPRAVVRCMMTVMTCYIPRKGRWAILREERDEAIESRSRDSNIVPSLLYICIYKRLNLYITPEWSNTHVSHNSAWLLCALVPTDLTLPS